WAKSPRHKKLNKVDPKLTTGTFMKLAGALPKKHASVLMWLCTGHCPLNDYLCRIKRAVTNKCPHCLQDRENLSHYLYKCPQYTHQ
ncbi:hypothetical protein OG21DRAFT_1415790, partial [Imleria badia]